MPILWRYLLSNYIKVLVICVVAFIGVLLTTRLDEIARFATFGVKGHYILRFASYQVPYILPIAIPISCLISSIILFQQMSQTQELTALRACGLALRQVVGPILIAGAFLSLLSFYVVSELATRSHLETRRLEYELRSVNPLLLIQHAQALRVRGLYVNVLGSSRPGEQLNDVVVATQMGKEDRLHLLLSQQLEADNQTFRCKKVSLLGSGAVGDPNQYDHLLVENLQEVSFPILEFSNFIKRDGWSLKDDHLRMPLLIVRTKAYLAALKQAKVEERPASEIRYIIRRINTCLAEISRRLSAAVAAFAFTLMGTSFGINLGRRQSVRGILAAIALSTLYLLCFFLGKNLDHYFLVATLLYTAPLVLIIVLSVVNLRRFTRGIE